MLLQNGIYFVFKDPEMWLLQKRWQDYVCGWWNEEFVYHVDWKAAASGLLKLTVKDVDKLYIQFVVYGIFILSCFLHLFFAIAG